MIPISTTLGTRKTFIWIQNIDIALSVAGLQFQTDLEIPYSQHGFAKTPYEIEK